MVAELRRYLEVFRFHVYIYGVKVGCSNALMKTLPDGTTTLTLAKALNPDSTEDWRDVVYAAKKGTVRVVSLDRAGGEMAESAINLHHCTRPTYRMEYDAKDSGVLMEMLMFSTTFPVNGDIALEGEADDA